MRSITLEQAAFFAALAMILLAGYQLADNAVLLETSPALVILGSTVPNIVWAGFFFVVSRRPASASSAAWLTLVFAVFLDVLVAYIRFQQSVSYWTPFGNAFSLSGGLLRLGWTAFLISFALSPDILRTRRIALMLAVLAAPSALSIAYDAWNSGIGLLFDDIPRQAFWRVLITPAIRTIYWLSQILFPWTAWGNPPTRDPLEQSSERLAP